MTAPLSQPIDLVRPPQILFGSGVAARVGSWISRRNLTKAFVVADTFNATRVEVLNLTCETIVFDAFRPEPDAADLERLLAAVESAKPDLIIGFGGGSAMDLAKLAAVLPGSGQHFMDVVGPDKVSGRARALIQVPTTAGTGSEAGTRALVTDPKTLAKLAVQSDHMLADLAAVDPDLTLTVPRAITVATGVDALAHCVEAYTNKKAHPTIDLYALEGIRLVGRWLPRAAENGADRDARAGMALASLYGGICLGPVNTAGGHAVAYPLGSRHHIPHGAANALIFPHVLAFNAPAVAERTATILAALGLESKSDPASVFAAAHQWCVDLGCEMRLSAMGVPADDLPIMADEAHAIRRLLDNNPRDLTRDDILAIYLAAA
ncbi:MULTISPECIES: iron-containing alcohol dehydrogenase [Rhodopseudomonas]|uniref:Alcohol dehydrogenase n=1 Tax=Rhodopseudomonas palustris TaxID=1076 RepID=A0A0D7F5A0_RHOPL|nr:MULTISPECIES: iron-containing alcohol dehydrogenase [Rhodopseudomonas]KIZ47956.1 alcohol dehydrogenase [Rhodopseudomonas palustris]MDF3811146.1 iron-containing alcohol dehydrogenase [Rhodopseudomonas sp. BAL398]WOK16783.1 iron-containing alcohol dehydrogenase [Rhodopseudomonas sp. BAL398]